MSNFHRDALPGDIHVVYQFTYANAAARLAAVLTSDDIGKIARQTDNETYWILKDDSPLTWQNLGAGSGSGGINYIENYDIESDASGYVTYADGAAAPVDGGGGSPTLTAVRSTSSPLRGSANLLLTPGALGNGVAYAFTIARADFARMIKVSFDYEIGTPASYTDGDVGVFVISASDSGFTTNLEVQQLAPYKLLKALGQETFEGVFQSHASNLYYRICIHQITSATGYTLKVDNVLVGPGSVAYGAPVGDWKPYTITITGSVSNPTKGTTSVDQAYYRRVGDSVEIRWEYSQTGSGTAGSGDYLFSLPSGLSIDTTKLGTGAPNRQQSLGEWIGQANNSDGSNGSVVYGNSTNFRLFKITSSGGSMVGSGSFPLSESTGVKFGVNCLIPISGWSSSVEVSSDASTRVVAAKTTLSAISGTFTTGNIGKVSFNSTIFDTAGIADLINSRFIAPIPGIYKLTVILAWSATAGLKLISYRKNGGSDNFISSIPSSDRHNASVNVKLDAGDYIEVYARQDSGGNATIAALETNTSLSFERLSGPAQIAASEFVGARYKGTSGGTINNNSITLIDYNTKDFDTHGCVTTGGSWAFVAPINGYYRVSAIIQMSSSTSAEAVLYLYKNGSQYSVLESKVLPVNQTRGGSDDIYLLAGDSISIRAYQIIGSSTTFTTGQEVNHVSIVRINK